MVTESMTLGNGVRWDKVLCNGNCQMSQYSRAVGIHSMVTDSEVGISSVISPFCGTSAARNGAIIREISTCADTAHHQVCGILNRMYGCEIYVVYSTGRGRCKITSVVKKWETIPMKDTRYIPLSLTFMGISLRLRPRENPKQITPYGISLESPMGSFILLFP